MGNYNSAPGAQKIYVKDSDDNEVSSVECREKDMKNS
jgi:hypothetical protein